MKKLAALIIMAGLGAIPALAATFHNAPVIDVKCHNAYASNVASHTRACAVACADSGYGIFTKDHKYLKFNEKGNQEVLKELKASDQTNNLRVNVSGTVKGDTLDVASVHLVK